MYRILTILLLALAAGIILIPDWFPNPRERIIGAWQDQRHQITGTVDEQSVRWQMLSRHGRLAYQWKQTEKEPYQVEFYWGEQIIPANITFHGHDEVWVEPQIMHLLDPHQRELIQEANKARKRQPDELKFSFKRISTEERYSEQPHVIR